MFPFPFHPSMLASMASMQSSMQSSRSPPRSATPPPQVPKVHSPPQPAAKEEDEVEQRQKRLRHESSAKDDDAGESLDKAFAISVWVGTPETYYRLGKPYSVWVLEIDETTDLVRTLHYAP